MQAHTPHGMERAQPLHHIGLGLLHHMDVADDKDQQQHDQDRQRNGPGIKILNKICHFCSSLYM